MSDNTTRSASPPHSTPIPISARNRTRSVSISSSGSSMSSASELPPTPPGSSAFGSQRVSIPSPSTSPILSYFLGQSPTKTTSPMAAPGPGAFPFRRNFGPGPVFEEDEEVRELPVAAHTRRASVTVANRFSGSQSQTATIPEALQDRGAGLLRRLSLSTGGGAFGSKPQFDSTQRSPPSPPPNTAVNTAPHGPPAVMNKPRRSATVSEARPRRAPSPMGERILKGHFDGFN